jgi:hypothetical protein
MNQPTGCFFKPKSKHNRKRKRYITMATKTTTTSLNVLPTPMPRTLEQCEAVIDAGLRGFVEAGRALDEIKTNELYKDRVMAATWKTYCKERWSMTSAQADRLINSARVIALLEDSQKVPIGTLPDTESVSRPLNQLPRGKIADAWNESVEIAKSRGLEKPTADIVQRVVDTLKNDQDDARRQAQKAKRIQRENKSAKTSAQQQPKQATPNIRNGKYKEFAVKLKGSLEEMIVNTAKVQGDADKADQEWFESIIQYLRQLQGLVVVVAIPK